MLQKTYYKTKDYCKVKFSFKPELAETVEILGLNKLFWRACSEHTIITDRLKKKAV